jgi:hypothetical protein
VTWLLNSVVEGQHQFIGFEEAASNRGLFVFSAQLNDRVVGSSENSWSKW